MQQFLDVILHLDVHLNAWAALFGPWLYLILFLIIFCETGLVVTPFLPGDSLLFAIGAMTAVENPTLELWKIGVALMVAGILGDAVNYWIGKHFSEALLASRWSKYIKREHLKKTEEFYLKHGGKTVIFARFMPIVRTFAPFVAGMAKMPYRRFFIFNVVGAIFWVWGFLLAGHFFGGLPSVKSNFHVVIFAIIGISFLPVVIEFWRARSAMNRNPVQL